MNVLGIETSCDETAAAVVDERGGIASSVVASQVALHAPYGGVVPEIAARSHLELLPSIVERALEGADRSWDEIGGIAVTAGPGLIGCLLVGISFARGASWARDLPVVAVNHLEGHVVSGWIDAPELPYPALALVVSGGHTGLWRVRGPGEYEEIARTRDDAAGEAFDKVAKMLGLPYPGGPAIDRAAPAGDPKAFRFGAVRLKGAPGFSFSGYKTAVRDRMREAGIEPLAHPDDAPPGAMLDLVASFRRAVVRELLRVTKRAIEAERPRSLVVAGGVAANALLRERAAALADEHGLALAVPALSYCGDNAAMIALAGRRRLLDGANDVAGLDAVADLPLGRDPSEPAPRRHR